MNVQYEDVATASDDYARRFAGAVGAWFLEVQGETVCGMVARVQRERSLAHVELLDVGGGHGQVLQAFPRNSGVSVSILASEEAAARQVQVDVQRGDARLFVADLLRSGLKDRSFDVVTCVRLLPHVGDWQALITELCRLARHAVIIDYPPMLSANVMYPLLFRLKKHIEGNTRTFRIFTHGEIKTTFEKSGFRLDARRGQFVLPMVMHRRVSTLSVSRAAERAAALLRLDRLLGNPVVALFVREP